MKAKYGYGQRLRFVQALLYRTEPGHVVGTQYVPREVVNIDVNPLLLGGELCYLTLYGYIPESEMTPIE